MTSDPVSIESQKSDPEASEHEERLLAFPGSTSAGRPHLRWILPLVALSVGGGIFWLFVATRDIPEDRDPVIPSPLVRVMTVQPKDVRFTVTSRGMVTPRTESDLVAEVRGRVLSVSERLVVGGFFAFGDELLRLDDREHRIARDRAEAFVRLRESEARLAKADADRRRQLRSRGAASAADLEQFESRQLVAEASLAESRAALAQVELDLERTIVRAPFDGRVRERNVDVGQFVSPGTKIGRIFAVDYAEVRLPIQIDELAYLDAKFVGLDRQTDFETGSDANANATANADAGGALVRLTGRLGGRELRWEARLVRAEAAIDEQTRMLNVVARVDDPYLLRDRVKDSESVDSSGVPLPAGLFVKAEIEGQSVSDVFVVPVMALRDGDRVFLRDEDDRLRVREVSVLRRDRGEVVIDGGLAAGDHIVISPLRIYSEGMSIRTLEAGSQ
jgi:multidrug efflux system membrane fusion protein